MRFITIASSLGFFFLSGAAVAQQAPADVQNIENTVNMMVRLCVGGGRVEAMTGGGTGGADISLRSLDVKGHVTGEVTVSKSSAEGLVNGIDNAVSQVAAAEADKVRVCLQPVRERLLDILLPAPKTTEQLEEARKRAAEAEARLQPRTLTKEKQELVVSMLMPFAGTQFDVGVAPGDGEAAEFMAVLEAVLQTAGWTEVDWNGGDIVMTREGRPVAGLVTATNVAIGVHAEKKSTLLGNAAAALSSALNAEGIVARSGTVGTGFFNKNADAVHILIGRKT
jgi:hypothetical protein